MADTHVALRWTGAGLRFEAKHPSGTTFEVDGDGQAAHSPVQALALALASCTAADIVDITGRMRVSFQELRVEVEADRNPQPPRYFTAVRMACYVSGVAPQDQDKVQRALELSQEKYCSVLHTLRRDMTFSSRLVFQ